MSASVPCGDLACKAIEAVGATSVLLASHLSVPAMCCVFLLGDAAATNAYVSSCSIQQLQQRSRELQCVPLVCRCSHGSVDCRLQCVIATVCSLTAAHSAHSARWPHSLPSSLCEVECERSVARLGLVAVVGPFAARLLQVRCHVRLCCSHLAFLCYAASLGRSLGRAFIAFLAAFALPLPGEASLPASEVNKH